MKENREEYQNEKEKREKRLLAYADMIQSAVQQDSSDIVDAGKVCECIGKTHRSKYT